MKEKRNCGMPYPMYPQNVPMMGVPTPYMTGFTQGYTQNSISSNTALQQISNLEQQISNLEQQMTNLETRVSRLENALSSNNSNNNQYNGSNYYMV